MSNEGFLESSDFNGSTMDKKYGWHERIMVIGIPVGMYLSTWYSNWMIPVWLILAIYLSSKLNLKLLNLYAIRFADLSITVMVLMVIISMLLTGFDIALRDGGVEYQSFMISDLVPAVVIVGIEIYFIVMTCVYIFHAMKGRLGKVSYVLTPIESLKGDGANV